MLVVQKCLAGYMSSRLICVLSRVLPAHHEFAAYEARQGCPHCVLVCCAFTEPVCNGCWCVLQDAGWGFSSSDMNTVQVDINETLGTELCSNVCHAIANPQILTLAWQQLDLPQQVSFFNHTAPLLTHQLFYQLPLKGQALAVIGSSHFVCSCDTLEKWLGRHGTRYWAWESSDWP